MKKLTIFRIYVAKTITGYKDIKAENLKEAGAIAGKLKKKDYKWEKDSDINTRWIRVKDW